MVQRYDCNVYYACFFFLLFLVVDIVLLFSCFFVLDGRLC